MALTYAEFRKELLMQILAARKEYFRLKAELDTLSPKLPNGCYIGSYISNRRWKYYTLGNKDAILPSATNPQKMTGKLHLGLDHNPKYRIALLEVEKARLRQVKEDTLEGITRHLSALKTQWRRLRSLREDFVQMELRAISKKTPEGKELHECLASFKEESVFQFVLRQHHARSSNKQEE